MTLDAATNGECGPDASVCAFDDTLTFAHITGSGSNRAMVVGCSVSAGSAAVMPNISTITYAGVGLSLLAKQDANFDTYLYTLPNGTQPTTGNNNVVVTLASAFTGVTIDCVALTVTGVDQTTTWTVSDCTGSGNSATASCTLGSSGSSDLVIVGECNGTSIGTPTGAITRQAFHNSSLGACDSFGMGTAAGSTTAISWNNNGNDHWEILAAAFKAVSGATLGRTVRVVNN